MRKDSKSPKETQKLAGFFLRKIAGTGIKTASVVALEGELGAGKTTFTQGIAKELGIKARVKSPTFNLMKRYEIPAREGKPLKFTSLIHMDCYRLRDHKDLGTFGIGELFSDEGNLILIEWSDRVKKILPKKHHTVHIDHIDKNKRHFEFKFG